EKSTLNYLNEEALPELIASLEDFMRILKNKEDDREELDDCYRKINFIFGRLKDTEASNLSPCFYDIKAVVNLTNKYKIRTKGTSSLSDKENTDISDTIYETLEKLRGLEKERLSNG
ncbi:hypothetical protein, partial [Bacillus pumilus]|uniref:hypothetical protein n=1 Tax=Bacillus pumilus TaxID=1408 RepID=UPI0016423839